MDFVVQTENHGLPQARHRVMLLGVREDMGKRQHHTLARSAAVSVREAIGDLPAIRSLLSRGHDSLEGWCYVFLSPRAEALAHPAKGEALRRSGA